MNSKAPLNQLPEHCPATLRPHLHLKQSLRPALRKHPLEEPVQFLDRLRQLAHRVLATGSSARGLRNA